MPLARAMADAGPDTQFVFVDDGLHGSGTINGHRVLTYQAFLAEPAPQKRICIAIGDSGTRARLAERCEADGLGFFSVVASNAVIGDAVVLGEGHIVSPFALLTSNITIGRHVHVNMHTYIAHDCKVGDFVTFGPAVCCNGNVAVADHAYVGSGAMIRQGRPDAPRLIGRGARIGMGAVVLTDIPAGVTVVGNPARPL
jgi:sugar O-acyltransferase (sialic acid O-acetyltransferase NeuD family)